MDILSVSNEVKEDLQNEVMSYARLLEADGWHHTEERFKREIQRYWYGVAIPNAIRAGRVTFNPELLVSLLMKAQAPIVPPRGEARPVLIVKEDPLDYKN